MNIGTVLMWFFLAVVIMLVGAGCWFFGLCLQYLIWPDGDVLVKNCKHRELIQSTELNAPKKCLECGEYI